MGSLHRFVWHLRQARRGWKSIEPPVLSVSPFLDEQSQDADAHIEWFKYVLELEDFLFFLADNCNTNKSIGTPLWLIYDTYIVLVLLLTSNGCIMCPANKAGISLLGCRSHRLALAVKQLLEPYEAELLSVDELVHKCMTCIGRAMYV